MDIEKLVNNKRCIKAASRRRTLKVLRTERERVRLLGTSRLYKIGNNRGCSFCCNSVSRLSATRACIINKTAKVSFTAKSFFAYCLTKK